MKKKKIIITLILAAIFIIGITFYFELENLSTNDQSSIEASGTIEVTEIDISSKLAGRIVSLPFVEGQKVKKGELLVRLEYSELQAQLDSTVANLANARKNLKRAQKLYQSKSISTKEWDNARTAYQVAHAGYLQVKAAIKEAVILSPIDGLVLARNLEVGEMAFPGSSILTIANLDSPWMKVYVKEQLLPRLELGQKAKVIADGLSEKPFEAKILSISPKAEFTPKTIQTKDERVKLVFAVKLAIDNPNHVLKPGLPADARIELKKIQPK